MEFSNSICDSESGQLRDFIDEFSMQVVEWEANLRTNSDTAFSDGFRRLVVHLVQPLGVGFSRSNLSEGTMRYVSSQLRMALVLIDIDKVLEVDEQRILVKVTAVLATVGTETCQDSQGTEQIRTIKRRAALAKIDVTYNHHSEEIIEHTVSSSVEIPCFELSISILVKSTDGPVFVGAWTQELPNHWAKTFANWTEFTLCALDLSLGKLNAPAVGLQQVISAELGTLPVILNKWKFRDVSPEESAAT